jgi:hypothetical protein
VGKSVTFKEGARKEGLSKTVSFEEGMKERRKSGPSRCTKT